MTFYPPAPWGWYVSRYGQAAVDAMAQPGPVGTKARKELTRDDPLLFATVYLRTHLSAPETGGVVSFSRFHTDAYDTARTLARADLAPFECRQAWVAPRGAGKSTLWFLAIPLWALAHRHRKFVAAFADSGPQAQQHLSTFKRVLDTNVLLRRDFPKLCTPARRQSGTTVSDTQALYQSASGIAFLAKGIDASTLGAKVDEQRPDMLLFDDVEPNASNYSAYQAAQRLATITDAVLPMNLNAAVFFVGTVVMYGSVIHDLVRTVTHPEDTPAEWVGEQKITTRYYPALTTGDDGQGVSLWPERWPVALLESMRGTRSFQLNYQNDPAGVGSGYWRAEDLVTAPPPEAYGPGLIWVDPATTTNTNSDWTGIAVCSLATGGKLPVHVRHAEQVKLTGEPLRQHLLQMAARYPDVGVIVVESNQGGDHWHSILRDMPVRVRTHHATEPKATRIDQALAHFQHPGRVVLTGRVPAFTDQALAYPAVAHDDVVDAVASAVNTLTARVLTPPARPARPKVASYT